MKTSFVLFVALSSSMALSQSAAPKLGEAMAVDLHVARVDWHPMGKAIIYTKKEEDEKGIGVFVPGQRNGKIVMRVPFASSFDTTWLPGTDSAILTMYAPRSKGMDFQLVLVDADTGKASTLFAGTYAENHAPEVLIEPSPSLRHAIITFAENGKRHHRILSTDSNRLVDAVDLDKAEKLGAQGPNWMATGTAAYTNPSDSAHPPTTSSSLVASGSNAISTTSTATFTAIPPKAIPVLSDVPIVGTLFISRPGIAPGTMVYELNPSQANLFESHYQPWSEVYSGIKRLRQKNSHIVARLDQSVAEADSTWLKEDSGLPAYVAANASKVWISPRSKGVAYLIDGALFVRTIQ